MALEPVTAGPQPATEKNLYGVPVPRRCDYWNDEDYFNALGIKDDQAQDRNVTGTVLSSEDNAEVPGVNVVVKGTTIGTITDMDGKALNENKASSELAMHLLIYKMRPDIKAVCHAHWNPAKIRSGDDGNRPGPCLVWQNLSPYPDWLWS